jgi:glycosyltransferase involved in cell wall biosynthesis
LFEDVGVLAFVPDRWDRPGVVCVREQVLTRMAKYFHVVWVNPAREWREIVWKDRRAHGGQLPTPHISGFTIYDPALWLPQLYRPRFLSQLTQAIRSRRASAILTRKGCVKNVLYLWRPGFARALEDLRYDLSVYHIDDEYTYSDKETPLTQLERDVIERVDQVVIHSPALLEKKGHINPNTAFVPNGVDFKSYSAPAEEPADLGRVPRPRVGYVGNVKKQLDLELLLALAKRHDSWSFVFIGPTIQVEGDKTFKSLAARENVHFLGNKALQVLPAYTQHLDVCMLCYKVNDYTKYIFPLKLHEYLAAGRPVVGAPIQTLLHFQEVVQLARTLDEWSRALSEALAPGASSDCEANRRKSIARRYDWEVLVRAIVQRICVGLGESYANRFREMSDNLDVWSCSPQEPQS